MCRNDHIKEERKRGTQRAQGAWWELWKEGGVVWLCGERSEEDNRHERSE